MTSRRLGRRFGWLWSAYAVSAAGTWLAFNAFNVILIRVLHAGPAQVAVLAAAGPAVGALAAVPLGPWIEYRRKRPVMVAMDLIRFGTLLTVPLAYAFGALSFAQLLVVSIVVGACDITFGAASGAYLKSIVAREDLMVANSRFEATMWTSIALGPPLGGVAVAVLGPVTTVVADAASFLLSALGLRAIGDEEPEVETGRRNGTRTADLLEGWRHILRNRELRPLFLNNVLVNALIMTTEPMLAVLMLGRMGFPPWEFGLAFAVPCVGGLVGSRMSTRLVERFGRHKVLIVAGTLRVLPPIGLVFLRPGLPGLLLVIGVELALITSASIFSPALATQRLEETDTRYIARVLSAWSVSTKAGVATATAVWGLLAAATSPRFATGLAGVLLLATPLALPFRSAPRAIAPAKNPAPIA